MNDFKTIPFDSPTFLATAGFGRSMVARDAKQVFFSQGGPSNCIFYLHSGLVRFTVVSPAGKQAALYLRGPNDFLGEEALAETVVPRIATATAITPCIAIKISRDAMLRTLQQEPAISALFLAWLSAHHKRTQADLIDQLFNGAEKRLARALLLMAGCDESGHSATLIPSMRQEDLAAMVGTTRSRVSFFMNRFRRLGFIEYHHDGIIRVDSSLLHGLMHDMLHPALEWGPDRPTLLRQHTPSLNSPKQRIAMGLLKKPCSSILAQGPATRITPSAHSSLQ